MHACSLSLGGLGLIVLTIYLGLGLQMVSCWPGGSAMYECCCPDNFGCRKSCFTCRNNDFICNCDLCSCYLDVGLNDINPAAASNNDLLSLLLRNGAGRKGRNWQFPPGR